MAYVIPIILLALTVAQHSVTGRFLIELERDNPEKYKEVWPFSESLLSTLLPFRFGLLYVVSGTYEYWSLGPDGLRLAKKVKVITWTFVIFIFIALAYFVLSVIS